MIGSWPFLCVGVAVRPTTYLALTCRITCSNVNAEMWWHSFTIPWPYSATRSFTCSLLAEALDSRSPIGRAVAGDERQPAWTPRFATNQAATAVVPKAVGAQRM